MPRFACLFLITAIASSMAVAVPFRQPQYNLPRRATSSLLCGNDDGWAEANIRALYQQAKAAGYNALVSAPAENKSGTGSSSGTPTTVTNGCEFDSCPAGSPPTGHDATDDHLWYVNAYPVDGITYGLNSLSSTYLGGPPTLATTGPNVGTNLGIVAKFSGTVGAATAAAKAGIPAIAFSGTTGDQRSYTELVHGDYSFIYADGALRLIDALIAGNGSDSSLPLLPSGIALNVNFPAAGPSTSCTTGSDFKFVLSRVITDLHLPIDVHTCGESHLHSEHTVVETAGCYASVSVMDASTKLDTTKANQAYVFDRLSGFLSCLPS